jgi:hypothetical protein
MKHLFYSYVYAQFLGWQGVVPCKTEKMASRLVTIVTERLLSVEEAFGNMDPSILASLLQPLVEDELRRETHGEFIVTCLRPFLPYILTRVVTNLQLEIGTILDLRSVVLEAFVRDKGVLVELFQKVIYVQCSLFRIPPLFSSFPFGWCVCEAWVGLYGLDSHRHRASIINIYIHTPTIGSI